MMPYCAGCGRKFGESGIRAVRGKLTYHRKCVPPDPEPVMGRPASAYLQLIKGDKK